MSEISYDDGQRLATLLSGAIKGIGFYPAGHPAILNPLQEIIAVADRTLPIESEIRLGVVDGVFFTEKHLFFTPSKSIEELASRLEQKEITGIVFTSGITIDSLSRFVSLLGRNDLQAEQIVGEIAAQGITGVTVLTTSDNDDREEILHETACRKTRQDAVQAVDQIFREVEAGRIPSSDKMTTMVREMASLTVKDSAALLALSMIKDYDNYTFNHSVNVGVISMAIASHIDCSKEEIEIAGLAGFLHDVGKVRIEKSILNKPGKLTAMEFEQMKKHTESGTEIIEKMQGISPRVAQAVLGHHIGYNRKGYPEWAREMTFSSTSDIVAVADCYDAITTLRVYRKPCDPRQALVELQNIAGTYLNGAIVENFREMMGPYPVGTVVRLDTNEIGVVYGPNLEKGDAPKVKIVIDGSGGRLAIPIRKNLLGKNGDTYARIVAVVDPLLKNIDVAACLSMPGVR